MGANLIIGIIFVLLVLVLNIRVAYVNYCNRKKASLELYSDEISNVLEENASILNMNCFIEQNNSFINPRHNQKYKITFSLYDGTQKVLYVPMEDYSNMNVG